MIRGHAFNVGLFDTGLGAVAMGFWAKLSCTFISSIIFHHLPSLCPQHPCATIGQTCLVEAHYMRCAPVLLQDCPRKWPTTVVIKSHSEQKVAACCRLRRLRRLLRYIFLGPLVVQLVGIQKLPHQRHVHPMDAKGSVWASGTHVDPGDPARNLWKRWKVWGWSMD